jgi:hypothetical protein
LELKREKLMNAGNFYKVYGLEAILVAIVLALKKRKSSLFKRFTFLRGISYK